MKEKQYYEVVSVEDELPGKDDFYFTIHSGRPANNWLRNGKWLDEILSGNPSSVTHWLRPLTGILMSKEQVEKQQAVEKDFHKADIALYETRLALMSVLKVFNKEAKTPAQQKCLDDANARLKKHFNAKDILRK